MDDFYWHRGGRPIVKARQDCSSRTFYPRRNRSQDPPDRLSARYQKYSYETLAHPRSIRLLDVIDANYELGIVFAYLREYHLDQCPEFHALSYTWGSALEDTIGSGGVSNQPFSNGYLYIITTEKLPSCAQLDEDWLSYRGVFQTITSADMFKLELGGNLLDFLLCFTAFRARNTGDPTIQKLFWIDAICINQADRIEKAIQIPLMGDIYSKASAVIVWLGKDEQYVSDFLWLHNTVLPAMGAAMEEFETLETFLEMLNEWSPLDNKEWLAHVGIDCGEISWLHRWKSYIQFFRSRRWFRRAWVVQEVCLARETFFLVGNELRAIPWDQIELLVTLMFGSSWENQIYDACPVIKPGGKYEGGFGVLLISTNQGILARAGKRALDHEATTLRDTEEKDRKYGEILTLLMSVRAKESTMPEDKVYATLGMLAHILPLASSLLRVIPSETIENLYTRVSTEILSQCTGLELLSYVGNHSSRKLKLLPSWVPDYTTPISGLPLTGKKYAPIIPVVNRLKFVGDRVYSDGVKLGVIKSRASLDRFGWLYECLWLLDTLDSEYSWTQQSRGEALWRSLIFDKTGDEKGALNATQPAPESYGTGFRCLLAHALAEDLIEFWPKSALEVGVQSLSNIISRLQPDICIPSMDEVLWEVEYQQTVQGNRQHSSSYSTRMRTEGGLVYATSLTSKSADRAFITTDEGMVGVCYDSCAPGDEIWGLPGGSVPYVLRPGTSHGEPFTFLGACYLHGAMHSEALAGNIEERLQEVCIA